MPAARFGAARVSRLGLRPVRGRCRAGPLLGPAPFSPSRRAAARSSGRGPGAGEEAPLRSPQPRNVVPPFALRPAAARTQPGAPVGNRGLFQRLLAGCAGAGGAQRGSRSAAALSRAKGSWSQMSVPGSGGEIKGGFVPGLLGTRFYQRVVGWQRCLF